MLVRLAILITVSLAPALRGATLEKLSLDEMIAKSTVIVRGRASARAAEARGPMIYTHWNVKVSEQWKGTAAAEIDIVTPGGTWRGLRQSFSGAPSLVEGVEYVMFLWTGRNGLTHIIGLSQGVFDLKKDAAGQLVVAREATSEQMLDARTGGAVEDEPVRMRLADLKSRVQRTLAALAKE